MAAVGSGVGGGAMTAKDEQELDLDPEGTS